MTPPEQSHLIYQMVDLYICIFIFFQCSGNLINGLCQGDQMQVQIQPVTVNSAELKILSYNRGALLSHVLILSHIKLHTSMHMAML